MKAVCLILYPKPKETKKENLTTVIDWWAASVKLLGDTNLMKSMRSFDKENIEEKII